MKTEIPMHSRILDIWSNLKAGKQRGLVKRLYATDCKINIYVIYQYPDDCYGIALSYPQTIKFDLTPFECVSEPVVEIFEDSSFEDCFLVSAKIKNQEKINEFSYLCENVIQTILKETKIEEAVKTFKNTLLRWKNLFEPAHLTILSEKEQNGLYGELSFLKKCLLGNSDSYYSILQNYVGTDRSLRDFQGKDWAVEVKTTSTNNPQTITINGERQLDDSKIGTLYLYHCSLEASKKTGETLPEIVKSIKDLLKDDVAALSLFKAKLFEANYSESQEHLYINRHYQLRKENFFHIKDDFPRIRESELREGVGDVTYSISISSLESYKVTEQQVLSKCLSDD